MPRRHQVAGQRTVIIFVTIGLALDWVDWVGLAFGGWKLKSGNLDMGMDLLPNSDIDLSSN